MIRNYSREPIQTRVRTRYDEPQRGYHTWRHIEELLSLWSYHYHSMQDGGAVYVAILWHDSIYNPARSDNEELSEKLMRKDCADLHPAMIAQAGAMILATKDHAWTDKNPDTALFLDFDLSILGAEAKRFAEFEEGVAHEYVPIYGRLAYCRGRSSVLGKLLMREKLFMSPQFERYEAQARLNLTRQIEVLKKEALSLEEPKA